MSGLGRKAVTTARTGSEAHAEEILALVDETPDITLGEIAAHLDAGHGLTVAPKHGLAAARPARHDGSKKNRARLRATAS